jgi:hypothetical protein
MESTSMMDLWHFRLKEQQEKRNALFFLFVLSLYLRYSGASRETSYLISLAD